MKPEEHQQTTDFDHGIAMRLAATILIALLGVFALQKLGFRFVVSAKAGMSA